MQTVGIQCAGQHDIHGGAAGPRTQTTCYRGRILVDSLGMMGPSGRRVELSACDRSCHTCATAGGGRRTATSMAGARFPRVHFRAGGTVRPGLALTGHTGDYMTGPWNAAVRAGNRPPRCRFCRPRRLDYFSAGCLVCGGVRRQRARVTAVYVARTGGLVVAGSAALEVARREADGQSRTTCAAGLNVFPGTGRAPHLHRYTRGDPFTEPRPIAQETPCDAVAVGASGAFSQAGWLAGGAAGQGGQMAGHRGALAAGGEGR